jgi:hypothetical protein
MAHPVSSIPPQSVPAAQRAEMASGTNVLELSVGELRQLFNAMDPAPFRERDLDPNAEDYIVAWAREASRTAPLALRVTISREPVTAASTQVLRDSVHGYFAQRAMATRKQLRQLFRVGRVSLVIGLVFLAFAIVLGEFVAGFASKESYSGIIKESFVIGGWVALWRPLEIFLYDWWPIRAEAKLFDRLGAMDVAVVPSGDAARGAA